MGNRRNLYQSKHPFGAYPFEALWSGCWLPVELIRIAHGYINISSVDGRHAHENCGPTTSLRIRSRRATSSDCICFLRPGIDVCVLSGESSKPVSVDARISSVQRRPHESRCSCKFYVKLYVSQRPLGSDRGVLSKETIMMGIDSISILQRLEPPQIESQLHRWATSEDTTSLPRTKILTGKFLSDISWLLVASAMKRVSFDIGSVNEKIVYQISGSGDSLKTVNFKIDNNIMVPVMFEHAPEEETNHEEVEPDESEPSPQTLSEVVELRRSKRRNIQPERFLGCDVSKLQINPYRSGLLKNDKWKQEINEDDELSLPLSVLFGKRRRGRSGDLRERKRRCLSESGSPVGADKATEEKEGGDDDDNITINRLRKPGSGRKRGRKSKLHIVPMETDNGLMSLGQYNSQTKTNKVRDRSGESSGGGGGSGSTYSFAYYTSERTLTEGGKSRRDLEDMDFGQSWVRNAFDKKADRRKYYRFPPKREFMNEERIYGQRTLSAGLYKDLINSYMKSIDSTKIKDEVPLIDQWKEFQSRSKASHRKQVRLGPIVNEAEEEEEEEEESELDVLWREMELCMTSSYLFEDNEGPRADTSNEYMEKAMNVCPHDFKLDEEIGIYCKLCGAVSIEVKDISPDFIQTTYGTTENKVHNGETEQEQAEDEGLDISYNSAASDMDLSEENRNVWTLIPDVGKKLHLHQKKAFEFLWKNVAGSLIPADMDSTGKKTGGCVVSHSPGAGKTFLIIAFLVSYLKLFPGKRPLVLAPKTTLYTWHKEFVKWQIPIPVYLIHGRRSYRVFRQDTMEFEGLPKPGQDVMHVLDCLEKIQKWHAQPSVLVMGYTSFLTLMREDSKFAHRKHMAKVLRESPGILILDEGHNPRSTKSRLRKVLMKVETDLRILLSGTLFQNNFCEYFNTLCLARPMFVNEVLKELDPKFKRKRKKKAQNLLEARARKFFIDNIGKKIDSSNGEERMQGLNMLRNMTSGFIDVYEGGNSDILPGLQSYTLLMNPTDIQLQVLLKLHRIMSQYHGYPLELELLITLGSIHPWLVKTACCANKFFSSAELSELDKHKFDIKKGSKVKFVLSLVYRVFRKEKTLIFCHNIAPINLFLELFENIFGWKKGKEVLVLSGDLELFERGRVMDTFEEPGSPSRVLIASITACAEGISLTAASRVILLDSEWNPSKTKQAIARAFRPGQQKVVYVYQLLAANTLEEDKYRRTTWKEWVSCMIFSEAFVEDPSCWQAQKIEDEILREMVEEDRSKSIHMIMKNEKASTS
ncbi:SNF2 domain-containing protein CLASSY 2-like [Punica granatum]|uniref:Uncharacterized protein n=2 Tax=Punica granatum TaxID=22663 RepID=A0A218XRG0_PUNGR|nr:SNF2 domain-containing protein CLASSY 2-like [Punica granatum]OWM87388.1 hypothetical protein CDL15_Pgr022499 [Punica granatum]PKI31799.1 hypothetical protein CRG98_047802 [Punica granatum]